MRSYALALMGVAALVPSATALSAGCNPRPSTCCKGLVAAGLGDKVCFPNQTTYAERLASYWSESAALSPWCMVLPSTAEDVSITMKSLVRHNCPFGIRGGGHSSFALSSSVEHGVTIDFGNMNGTTYDPETQIASIQPGSQWQNVFETLGPHGVTATGGRTGTVGVGGFLTGGGNSFHSASHGMGCDNVANFEIVIANGSIINANSTENPDLWVALKGGSANFGLVTRFDLHVIEFPDAAKPDLWASFLSFNLTDGDAVLDAMESFTDNAHLDQNTTSIMFFGHVPAAGGMVLNVGLENTMGIRDPPAVDVYRKAGEPIANFGDVIPMTEIVSSENPGQAPGYRNIWFTLSFKNDARVMKYAAAQHELAVKKLLTISSINGSFNTMCSFQPLNKIIAEHGVNNGGNVMGLDYWTKNGNGILFLAQVGVHGVEEEKMAYPIMKEWTDAVDAYAKELGVGWGWKYLNYAGREQDPLASVGPGALGKLRAASAKYDPLGIFQTLRVSGFKIPKTTS